MRISQGQALLNVLKHSRAKKKNWGCQLVDKTECVDLEMKAFKKSTALVVALRRPMSLHLTVMSVDGETTSNQILPLLNSMSFPRLSLMNK